MATLINLKCAFVFSFVFFALTLLNWPSIAQADDISVQGSSGTWNDVSGGTALQGTGTNQIYWGASEQTKAEKSSLLFTAPSPTIYPVTLGQTFDLGTWTYINDVIPVGAGIKSATLNIATSFDIDGTLIKIPLTFDITHTETPNIPSKCLPGSSTVCDDSNTFTNNHSQSYTYTINGDKYTIDILGFFSNGQLAQQILTGENEKSSAVLEAIITETNVPLGVPEPSTYLILGSTMIMTLWSVMKGKKTQGVQNNFKIKTLS
jgi:hypothetical protein